MPRLVLAYPHFHSPDLLPSDCHTQDVFTACDDIVRPGWPNSARVAPRRWPERAAEDLRALGGPGTVYLPMSEEAVWPCAIADGSAGAIWQARVATLRHEQRRVIEETHPDLNPPWCGVRGRYVAKAPARFLSCGVQLMELPRTEYANNLPIDDDPPGVVEEFVEGRHYEVSGVCGKDGPIRFFRPMGQVWSRPVDVVLKYTPVVDGILVAMIRRAAERVVLALGFRNCGFCVELKGSTGAPGLRLIEAHRRLGTDVDPYARLCGSGTHMEVELVREILRGMAE